MGHHEEESVQGTVKAINFAPKGEVDGMLLEVGGKVVQVNIGHDQGEGLAGLIGQPIGLTVGPEPAVAKHGKGEHPVHKFIAFRGEGGPKPGPAGDGPKPPGHGPKHDHGHGHGEPAEVKGTVARLNYAKHGEANGVVLDGGEFVHLKPDGMKLAGLAVGQAVSARGKATPRHDGGRAIEAEVVNGVDLKKKPH